MVHRQGHFSEHFDLRFAIFTEGSKIMEQAAYKEKRKEFSRRGISELLDLLSSDDLQTRFFAEMSLRDATST